MQKILSVILVAATWPAFAPAAQAQSQSLDDLFTRVSPTVVVVRAKGRDVTAGGSPAPTRRVPRQALRGARVECVLTNARVREADLGF